MRAVTSKDSRVAAKDGRKVVTKRKINPLSPPTTIELRGIRVHFPFRPYKCQETYMQTVMDALLKSENALLESPTGTGKTLCLLCACLAWQRQQSRLLRQAQELKATDSSQQILSAGGDNDGPVAAAARVPTIVYASRTHSQLSQVVRELRNTRYRPTHAVLASREQMCVNPKVKKPQGTSTSSDINHGCNKLGKERKCRFRNNLEGFTAPSNEQQGGINMQSVRDMEELVQMGQEHKICPFYYTRSQVEKAELVLVPYNYLFDKDARETTLADIPWDNAVLIFDEAHNLESFASESASFDLSNTDIAGCVSEVTKCINFVQSSPEAGSVNLKIENLVKLKALFLKLEHHICHNIHSNQTSYKGEFMMEIFNQGCGITHANHEILIEEVRKVNDFLMDLRGSGSSTRGSPRLEHFTQCLKRVFGYTLESRCLAKAAFYRVYVSPKPAAGSTGFTAGRTISYWCFAPAVAMEELCNLNVRSILVTSGTLSPLPSYSMELGLHFPHTLENPHIISNDQIHVRVVGKGVSGKLLNSSYERRKDDAYYLELGNTLVSIAKVTPAGMLVFFPSYSVMEKCLEDWGGPQSSRKAFENKNNFFAKKKKAASKSPFSFPFAPTLFNSSSGRTTPWKRMLSTKAVVVEPRSSTDLQDAMSEFVKFLGLPKSSGCILMGVCRGKISEGIDFANEQSRAVVITGLPFPPSFDPKVKMKREYLDKARAAHNTKASVDGGFGQKTTKMATADKLSGHEWYSQQAHRAVNQAIGRVIRNRADYGAVLLLDNRFGQPNNQGGLSKWLRPHIQKDEGFGLTIRGLADFYRRADSHAKKQAEENKKAAALPILEYEDDGALDEDELPSKVALIRKSATAQATSGDNDDSSAYVAPNEVVARMDVAELQKPRAPIDTKRVAVTTSKVPATKSNDAVFASQHQPSGGDATKKLALQFMAKVKANLPATEQSLIRKAIVAMKAAGERKDLTSYQKSAASAVRLVNRCEQFETFKDGGTDTRMLLLFFALLPKHYRKRIEISSFELVFDSSSLGATCKDVLEAPNLATIRASMGRLLQSMWCRTSDVPLPNEVYLHDARETLQMIGTAGKASSALLSGYLKLIPKAFHGPTRAWTTEMIASSNMLRMKAADKARKGEGSISIARFQRAPATTIKPEPFAEPVSNRSTTSTSQPQGGKRKLNEPFAAPRGAKVTVNPYARKTAPSVIAAAVVAPTLQRKACAAVQQKATPSVSSYLKKVESDVYVKQSAGDIAKRLKTNAPEDLTCPICSTACKDPLVADCGHIACCQCWLGWLKRSNSCMTCRKATIAKSLARVIYEKKPAAGAAAPTLSQLCAAEDSDDELEIVR